MSSIVLPGIPSKRYFTIGEVSELCQVKPHVLRYWEQEFTQLKPVKRRGNRRYYQHHEVLLTIEEGAAGGFGAQVLTLLAAHGVLDTGLKVRTMTLPDRFIDQGSPAQMYEWAGLTAKDIAATVRQALGRGVARGGLRVV